MYVVYCSIFFRKYTEIKRGNMVENDGSRNSDGNVPNVNWNDSKLKVNWNRTSNSNDNLRSRSEVSNKIPLYLWCFCFEWRSQPRDIFESSISFSSIIKYFFDEIIFVSYSSRTRCLSISILVRISRIMVYFSSPVSKEAFIPISSR